MAEDVDFASIMSERPPETRLSEPATDKQRDYLRSLLHARAEAVPGLHEKIKELLDRDELTKRLASRCIDTLVHSPERATVEINAIVDPGLVSLLLTHVPAYTWMNDGTVTAGGFKYSWHLTSQGNPAALFYTWTAAQQDVRGVSVVSRWRAEEFLRTLTGGESTGTSIRFRADHEIMRFAQLNKRCAGCLTNVELEDLMNAFCRDCGAGRSASSA